MRAPSPSSPIIASFLILAGIGGLAINLLFYSGEEFAMWVRLLGLAIYGFSLVAGIALLMVGAVRHRVRELVQLCVYAIVGGDLLRAMVSQSPDTLLWLIFIPVCGGTILASLARRWTEVAVHTLFALILFVLGGSLGLVPWTQAGIALVAVSVAGTALALGTTVRLRAQANLVRLNNDLTATNEELVLARQAAEA
ncbi:MAG: hypothetical protein AAF170_16390, partial [Bacteroidota bacterium]